MGESIRQSQTTETTRTSLTMQLRNITFIGLASLLSLGSCSEIGNKTAASEKASSPFINCGCQCSSLTFRDAGGVVQGNCLTVDTTGAQWPQWLQLSQWPLSSQLSQSILLSILLSTPP